MFRYVIYLRNLRISPNMLHCKSSDGYMRTKSRSSGVMTNDGKKSEATATIIYTAFAAKHHNQNPRIEREISPRGGNASTSLQGSEIGI